MKKDLIIKFDFLKESIESSSFFDSINNDVLSFLRFHEVPLPFLSIIKPSFRFHMKSHESLSRTIIYVDNEN